MPSARITAVQPLWAIEGARITIEAQSFDLAGPDLPSVSIGGVPARVVHASSRAVSVLVPPGLEAGPTPIRVDDAPGETAFIELGAAVATGLHQVDNPAFDRTGNLFVAFSGTRGQEAPVSIFRVTPDGVREPFASGITNPTSLTFDREGRLYVSSRFEGTVYRLSADGSAESVATDLGITCGLAFDSDGNLYAGDRSGTIFRVQPNGRAVAFATLPPSVAAFHLAIGPDEAIYVTAPTLAPSDSLYRITRDGHVEVLYTGFGRPQGLAFDAQGILYVVEALAGSSGLYRMREQGSPEQVLAAPGLIGIAFDPRGGMVAATSDTIYRLNVNVRGSA